MRFPFDALQLAIYTRLFNDADITQPVFDWPVDPEGQATPYIVIGDFFTEDASGSNVGGQRVTSEVHVWSTSQGMREVNDIMDEIVQSVTSAAIDLSADTFEYLQTKIEAEVRREYDGSQLYRHGIVRFIDIVYEKET